MNFLFVLLVASGLCRDVRGQVFEVVPLRPSATSFTCRGRAPGYYADPETGCKTYHVCDGFTHFTYVCPRRTLFQETSRICDHSHLVRCGEGEETDSVDEKDEILINPTKGEEDNDREDEEDQTETTPLEESTEIPTATTSELTVVTPEENIVGQAIKNFLKFRVKDLRALFFIPELNNNSVAVEPERELVLPLEKSDRLIFKSKKRASGSSFSVCPAYCNPRFFLPGTCHPCIMIK